MMKIKSYGSTQTNVNGSTYTFTRTYSRLSSFGAHSAAVALEVTDNAGNVSFDSVTITRRYIDNVNPTISSLPYCFLSIKVFVLFISKGFKILSEIY